MEDNSSIKHKNKGGLISIGLIFILLAIILIIFFLLRGEININGKWNGQKIIETATCESDDVIYPIFQYNNTNNRLLKIVSTFNDKVLENISLTYQLKYDDITLAEKSDAENQAAMNFSFGDDGYKAYAFDAKYSNIDGVFQMTLYIKSEDLDDRALKYFMLDGLSNSKQYTQDIIVNTYVNKGLNCIYKKNNNQ